MTLRHPSPPAPSPPRPWRQRPRTRRVAAGIAVGGAVVLALTGCAADGGEPVVAGPPSVSASPGMPVGPVPEGLGEFYAQTLTWGDCEKFAVSPDSQQAYAADGLECARMTVPLDYAQPAGRQVTVGVLRKAASGARTGSLVVNPGGPGASGMGLAADLASAVAGTPVGEHFDLVGFDPRGVGASEPAVTCLTGPENDARRALVDVDTSPAGIARSEQVAKDYANTCADRVGVDVLAHVGTREVVKDMDVLRSVLGEQKLTYLGYSYGTRIGTAYAEAFPANVRALVLDGAVDPMADPVQELVLQGQGFQGAFDAFVADCVKLSDCPLGPVPEAAVVRYRQLVNPLVAAPVTTRDPRGLSYADSQTGTLQALYSPQLWSALRAGLAQLAAGKGDTLLALADLYEGRNADGSYNNTNDAFNAIRCVDDPPLTDRATNDAAEAQYRKVAPFLDDGRATGAAALDTCAFWRVPATSTPHPVSAPDLPEVLVISTTGDPATPYAAGVDLARQLQARLLSFEGNQHTVALQGQSCVDEVVTAYLEDLKLPEEGTRC
ncbi:alpha/beta hydrolase [Rhodococcus sp. X156]|uniref:alpha/beta hydrolase n=1 Tax=Rhodococcus sp. X156 TaxID=2499145 RepID=UPI000FDB9E1E|nr:alpha/beta hydrolase [Rhodococcus sp. X156]